MYFNPDHDSTPALKKPQKQISPLTMFPVVLIGRLTWFKQMREIVSKAEKLLGGCITLGVSSFLLSTMWVWPKTFPHWLLFHIAWNQNRAKKHHGRVRHLSLCCDIVVESWNWVATPFRHPAEMMDSQTLALKIGIIRTFSCCVWVLVTLTEQMILHKLNFHSYLCNASFLFCQYDNNNHFAVLLLSLQRCFQFLSRMCKRENKGTTIPNTWPHKPYNIIFIN